ncbi:hypothetical protein CAEBREN_31505 [Caenorhabditis brenneri]|uniref:Uncharacterized protein n=1 Tax=Caenorhabditis brenneri TaxID=135651 RepID=G0P758_CAEBE|nr:hypothetical protein CAEBREN_31505 [Caenorhabditis brenneri]
MSTDSTPKYSNPEPSKTDSTVEKLRVKEYMMSPPKRYRRKEKKVAPSNADSVLKNEITASRHQLEMTDEEVIEALTAEMPLGSTAPKAPYDQIFGASENNFIKGIREAVKELEQITNADAEAKEKERMKEAAAAIAK